MTSQGQLGMHVLRGAWRIWKRFGKIIGDVIGRVVLTVFYFTVFAPFGLGVRVFGDPLAIKRQRAARWLERTTRDQILEEARRLS
jgi:hypothetical protein